MVVRFCFTFILLVVNSFTFAQNPSWPFEVPQVQPEDTVIAHAAFTLLYSEKHEQAIWVAYELLGSNSIKSLPRSNRFMVDPKVATGSANGSDFLKTGYDRGHLAPAADFGWSEIAMNESFYYSNMSPQLPSFNRGVWKRLETKVRDWSLIDSCIYIVTGPILSDSLKTIGANAVSVPNFYYKVILDYYSENPKGIGFVIPNASSSETLSAFAVTIDEVEQLTGINFFPSLTVEEEHTLEAHVCVSCWTWSASDGKISTAKTSAKFQQEKNEPPLKQSVQCIGVTKLGKRCGNKTLSSNQKCHLHSK